MFQVLTKRHARMRALLGSGDFWALVNKARLARGYASLGDGIHALPNAWIGVSTENQRWADIRIPALLGTPAAVRWISAEPLIGPIALRDDWLGTDPYRRNEPHLNWIVCGGESGPNARPMDPNWARQLRGQAVAASVAYHFKQFGEWAPNGWRGVVLSASNTREMLVGPKLDDMGHREVIERVGKKAAGRVLDGRTWDEFPSVAEAVTR